MLVFLGGTCNESMWRNNLIKYSNKKHYDIDWFNPIVKDWTPDCIKKEYEIKNKSDYEVYVITPKMTRVFSIAEAVDASNKKSSKTIFCVLKKDEEIEFTDSQMKGLNEVSKMIKNNKSYVFDTIEQIVEFINSKNKLNEYLPK